MSGRTCSKSVWLVQLMGWSSITARTLPAPQLPLFLATVCSTSRKVSMPTNSPYSITASEPMSSSAMVCTAWLKGTSGETV